MRINKIKFLGLSILIILLMDYSLFFLVDVKSGLGLYMSETNKTLPAFFSILLYVYVYTRRGFDRRISSFLRRYIYIYTISVLIVAIFTIVVFRQQSYKVTLMFALSYFTVLLVVPLFIYVTAKDSIDSLMQMLNVVFVIWCVLCIVQSLLYSRSGYLFLNYFGDSVATYHMRDGRLRLQLGSIGNLMVVYNFYRWLVLRQKQGIPFLCFALGLFDVLYVQQTRAMTLVVLLCLLVIMLFEKIDINKISRNILIVLLFSGIILSSGYFDSVINSFVSTENQGSVFARSSALSYYWSVFKNSPVYGLGFARADSYYSLLHGPMGLASLDDVGLLGMMASLGIFSIIIYLPVLMRMIKIVLYLKHIKSIKYSLCLSILVYYIVTSFTLIIFNPQRIMLLPIVLPIFEYVYLAERRAMITEGVK